MCIRDSHRSLAMRYSLFSMLHRWFSMHHRLLSMHHRLLSMRYRIPTNVVAKLQLNSDIPTNRDKIFIVFPVFYSYPSLHAVLTSTRFMTISAKIMTISTPLEGTSTKIMMTFTKIIMASTKFMMTFVKIIMTSTNDITTSAFLLSISATPQVLFTPKEHLPKPVQVNGVTPEVLIFSAETLVV